MPNKINKNRDRIYFKECFNINNPEHCKFMDYFDTILNIKYYQLLFAVNMLKYVDTFEEMKKCTDLYCLDPNYPIKNQDFETYKLRFGEKKGIEKYEEYVKKLKLTLLKLDIKNTQFLIDPETNKRITCRSYKFWMIKYDYSEEQAKEKVKNISKGTGKKAYSTRIKNPNWRDDSPTSIEYFIKRGLTEVQAVSALKERQTTFTLEKCIKKYGFEEGTKKYFDRQKTWVETLKNLPEENKLIINRKRKEALEKYWKVGRTFPGGFSKGSQEFAIKIFNLFKELFDIDYKDVFYATHEYNSEYYIIDNKQKYKLYDFAIKNNDFKIVIEYHGVVWHPKFQDYNFISPVGVKYEEAYQNDEYKKNLAIENKFDYYCFYENDNFVSFIKELFKDMYEKIKNKT